MARRDFQGRVALRKAALKRLADSKALLNAAGNHKRAATYLAGYAVECKLKAVAMEVNDCWTLEQLAARCGVSEDVVYQHGLESLFKRLVQHAYPRFQKSHHWRGDFVGKVNRWKPSWRYNPHEPSGQEAAGFVEAAERICQWLNNNV